MSALGTVVDGLVGSGVTETTALIGGNVGDVYIFYIGIALLIIIASIVFYVIRKK